MYRHTRLGASVFFSVSMIDSIQPFILLFLKSTRATCPPKLLGAAAIVRHLIYLKAFVFPTNY